MTKDEVIRKLIHDGKRLNTRLISECEAQLRTHTELIQVLDELKLKMEDK